MTLLAAKSNLRLPVVDETAIVFKTGSPAITATLDANALTAARVYGLPDASTALAGLAVAQTFTQAQTISGAVATLNLLDTVHAGSAFALINMKSSQGTVRSYISTNATEMEFSFFGGGFQLTSGSKLSVGQVSSLVKVGQISVMPTNTTVPGITVEQRTTAQVADLIQVTNPTAATVFSRFDANGYFVTAKNAAPLDAALAAGELAIWLDATPGATLAMFKAKDSGGTVRTGSVALS